jgi:hypothetical protein
MIKPKYKKGLDFSQLARSVVEHATGVSLTLPAKIKPTKKTKVRMTIKEKSR